MTRSLWIVPLAMALAACSSPAPAPNAMPGSDRDAHGCIGSAGYRWCERSAQCERPWELAKAKQFDNSAVGFDAYCQAAPATGGSAIR